MLTVLFIMLGLAGIGLIIMVATAPVGYQDEAGFHFGPEPALPLQETKEWEPDLILSSL